jgi:pilus assembly protein CpaF
MAVENSARSKFFADTFLAMSTTVRTLSKEARKRALGEGASISEAIRSVLDEHVERSEEAVIDEASIHQDLHRTLSGFAFLQPFLDDETIEEIWINRPGEIRYAKNGLNYQQSMAFNADDLKTQVERLIRLSGRRLDRSTPFIDAQLGNGYRLHAVIPDITREHLSLNIRKFSARVLTLQDLTAANVLSADQAELLVNRLHQGQNLLISGATQAGKTTLLSALISGLNPQERIVSVEDTFELRCLLPDWVAMQTRPPSTEGRFDVDLRRLVRESLRMRPSRLVVGEVRGAEALDLLIAMNSGIPGLCTIHANSAQEALKKIQTLPLLAGSNISTDFLRSIIGGSLNLFVHCTRDRSGKRRVSSILEITDPEQLILSEVKL